MATNTNAPGGLGWNVGLYVLVQRTKTPETPHVHVNCRFALQGDVWDVVAARATADGLSDIGTCILSSRYLSYVLYILYIKSGFINNSWGI